MQKNKITIAKENTLLGKIFYFFLEVFARPLIKFIWVKEVKGFENLPHDGPFIIAANHQSYFDFLTISSIVPDRINFLAAGKFFSSWLWRPIMEYTGQIKVEREASDKSEIINTALRVLKAGKIIALFPQGTRSRTGEIEKTYTGVARLALEARVPVVPIGIQEAFEVMPPSANRPKFKKIMKLAIGKPMEFKEYYEAEKTPGTL